jgi:hypothetical protein
VVVGCWLLVVGLLVCWVVGLLVCWFVGLLVCWFVVVVLVVVVVVSHQHTAPSLPKCLPVGALQATNLQIQEYCPAPGKLVTA